ncbi:unnamed protein product, partial [Brassica oleracea]
LSRFLPNHHLEKASADDTKHLLSHVIVDKSNHTLDYRESRLKTILTLPSPPILFWLVTLTLSSSQTPSFIFIFDYGASSSSFDQSNEFFKTLKLPARYCDTSKDPSDKPKLIIQCSKLDYVENVACILGTEEFGEIENSHLGSVVKLARKNNIQFSGELLPCIIRVI